jgi:RNA polymerase sigma factor (sigma-70 family)
MEVSALRHASTAPALRGPSPLLRLQSDERLVALTRRGQHAAFEALCARYQARLLSFVRHMLSSREDAEDVLQEVFAAAFNAVLADDREINVRPWLYRIARNRSLNHLRRASAVGVDSMDVHFADHGLSTGDRVLRRESFRELLADVGQLPETQRTALLLREIEALSYDQIAHAMDTTVPSVKSLLVRARISLAEAAESRKLSCDEVRLELGEVAEGLVKLSAPARRHVRDCDRCRAFKRQLKETNHALAAVLPIGPLVVLKKLLLAKVSSTASASSAHVASGAGATATVGAGAAAGAGAAGSVGAGGVFTVGAGALATKAVAGLAAAAIVSAGAVATNQPSHHHHHAATTTAYVHVERRGYEPVVVSEHAQPVTEPHARAVAVPARHALSRRGASAKLTPLVAKARAGQPLAAPAADPATPPAPAPGNPAAAPAAPPLTQLTSESTQLPTGATAAPGTAPTPGLAPAGSTPAGSPPAGSPPPAQPAPVTASAGSGPAAQPATATAQAGAPVQPVAQTPAGTTPAGGSLATPSRSASAVHEPGAPRPAARGRHHHSAGRRTTSPRPSVVHRSVHGTLSHLARARRGASHG